MSNIKELIRQEIERRKKICEGIFERESDTYYQGKAVAYGELLPFIDSLPEEKPSDDLEEAARQYTQEMLESWKFDSTGVRPIREPFIAGAEWQKEQMELDGIVTLTESDFDAEKEKASEWGYNLCKEQMMRDAVEAKIYGYDDGSFELIASWLDMPNNSIYKDGDKVKIIIVKKD